MICPNCNNAIDDDDDVRFCPHCRCKLESFHQSAGRFGDFSSGLPDISNAPRNPAPTEKSPTIEDEPDTAECRIPTSMFPGAVYPSAKAVPQSGSTPKRPSRRVTLYTLADTSIREKDDIEIEYAVNRLIHTDSRVNFCLRVKKLSSSLKMVNAWVKINDGE